MKISMIRCIVFLIVTAVAASAAVIDELKLPNGDILRRVKILAIDGDIVTVLHERGSTTMPISVFDLETLGRAKIELDAKAQEQKKLVDNIIARDAAARLRHQEPENRTVAIDAQAAKIPKKAQVARATVQGNLPLDLASNQALRTRLPPLTKAALSIRAGMQQITTSGSNWRDEWGSFSTSYSNMRALIVNMRMSGEFDPRVKLVWYFVGSEPTSGMFNIYDSGERDLEIGNTGTEVALISKSITLKRSRENTAPRAGSGILVDNSNRYLGPIDVTVAGTVGPIKSSGIVPAGWCVRVTQNGRVVVEIGSTPEMAAWTRRHIEN